MPAATEPPEAKTEREELLWQALKEHILLERQKKKEEQEAEVEEERLRKEREARDRQDAMTLGETREQIQLLNNKLEELRNEKQQLFLRLKKVLNEDENRKKQQQQKDSEMFALQNMVQQGSHPSVFLPPRAPHQQLMQKGGPQLSNQPIKRGRSPSPIQGYWKAGTKHEDGKRTGEVVTRNVLWNKPAYQNQPGTLYYPQKAPSIISYPSYQPNLNMTRQGYHVEIPSAQQQQPQNQQQHMKVESKTNPNAQVYHHIANMDQSTQQQMSQQQHKTHSQHGPPDRGFHLEMKHDERKDRLVQQQQQQQQQQLQQQPPTGHMSEGIVYTSLRPGMPPIHSNVMTLPPNQQGGLKPGGSITQGFPSRSGGPQGQPPPQSAQMHYQRHRF